MIALTGAAVVVGATWRTQAEQCVFRSASQAASDVDPNSYPPGKSKASR